MKKILKSQLFAFILGMIIASAGTAYAAYSIYSYQVSYTPSNSSWEVDNVEDALDYVYDHIAELHAEMNVSKLYEKIITSGYGENLNINYTVPDGVSNLIVVVMRTFANGTFQFNNQDITGNGLVSIKKRNVSSHGSSTPYNYLFVYVLEVVPGGTLNIKTSDTNLRITAGLYTSYVYAIY